LINPQQFQQIILQHNKNYPDCHSFTITGTNKKEKLQGVHCKVHGYITPIQVKFKKEEVLKWSH